MAVYHFVNSATGNNAGLFQTEATAYAAGDAGTIGVWSLDRGIYLDGNDQEGEFVSLLYMDDESADGALDVITRTIRPERFQITQQRSTGQPYATPIIYSKDVTRIKYVPYAAAIAQVSTSAVADAAAIDDIHGVKIVVKAVPTSYYEFWEPDNPNA